MTAVDDREQLRARAEAAEDELQRLRDRLTSRPGRKGPRAHGGWPVLKLADLREDQALSIVALADKANVSRQTLMRVERGDSRPTVDVAAKIMLALGVDLGMLGELFFDEHLAPLPDVAPAGSEPTAP